MSDLSKLYKEVILRHNNEPVNYEKRTEADKTIEAYNPICGDSFKIFLDMNGDIVEKAAFHGYGCAISKASTSVLVERIAGKTMDQVLELCAQFFTYVKPEESPKPPLISDFQAFEAAKQFPGRLKCATLSWEAISEQLKE